MQKKTIAKKLLQKKKTNAKKERKYLAEARIIVPGDILSVDINKITCQCIVDVQCKKQSYQQ